MQQDVHTQIINSDVLGLQCDGWSNRRNEPFVNFVLFNVGKLLLYKTMPTGVNRHTGEYVAELTSEVIEEVGPNKTFAVVTDNNAAMIKAREIIQRKYPYIEVYSCAALLSKMSTHLTSPIVKWITILEGDSCILSRVSEAFQETETCFEAVIANSPTSVEDDDSIRRSLQKNGK
ncbi:uncharacterized protein LOC117174608 isoform X2 [Belonocnema kinseyi]|nr:uncharacterized protein LOC117174608 isoform X2 [Belonocnema kinseyi]